MTQFDYYPNSRIFVSKSITSLMRITVAIWLVFTLLACSSLQGVQSRVTRPFQSAVSVPANGPTIEEEIESGLTTLGYNPGIPDGIMDARSELAIQEFQLDNNLTIDGKASTELLHHIQLLLNKP